MKTYNPDTELRPLVKRLLFFLVAAGLFCSRATAGTPPHPRPAEDKSKIEVRNNAASLLADLLGDEKNVSKILIIKHNSTCPNSAS